MENEQTEGEDEIKSLEEKIQRLRKREQILTLQKELKDRKDRIAKLEEQMKIDEELDALNKEKHLQLKKEKEMKLEKEIQDIKDRNAKLEVLRNGPRVSKDTLSDLKTILSDYNNERERLMQLEKECDKIAKKFKDSQWHSMAGGVTAGLTQTAQCAIEPLNSNAASAFQMVSVGCSIFSKGNDICANNELIDDMECLVDNANRCLQKCKTLKRKFDQKYFGNDNVSKMPDDAEIVTTRKAFAQPVADDNQRQLDAAKAVVEAFKWTRADSERGMQTIGENNCRSERMDCRKYIEKVDKVGVLEGVGMAAISFCRYKEARPEACMRGIKFQISNYVECLDGEYKCLEKRFKEVSSRSQE